MKVFNTMPGAESAINRVTSASDTSITVSIKDSKSLDFIPSLLKDAPLLRQQVYSTLSLSSALPLEDETSSSNITALLQQHKTAIAGILISFVPMAVQYFYAPQNVFKDMVVMAWLCSLAGITVNVALTGAGAGKKTCEDVQAIMHQLVHYCNTYKEHGHNAMKEEIAKDIWPEEWTAQSFIVKKSRTSAWSRLKNMCEYSKLVLIPPVKLIGTAACLLSGIGFAWFVTKSTQDAVDGFYGQKESVMHSFSEKTIGFIFALNSYLYGMTALRIYRNLFKSKMVKTDNENNVLLTEAAYLGLKNEREKIKVFLKAWKEELNKNVHERVQKIGRNNISSMSNVNDPEQVKLFIDKMDNDKFSIEEKTFLPEVILTLKEGKIVNIDLNLQKNWGELLDNTIKNNLKFKIAIESARNALAEQIMVAVAMSVRNEVLGSRLNSRLNKVYDWSVLGLTLLSVTLLVLAETDPYSGFLSKMDHDLSLDSNKTLDASLNNYRTAFLALIPSLAAFSIKYGMIGANENKNSLIKAWSEADTNSKGSVLKHIMYFLTNHNFISFCMTNAIAALSSCTALFQSELPVKNPSLATKMVQILGKKICQAAVISNTMLVNGSELNAPMRSFIVTLRDQGKQFFTWCGYGRAADPKEQQRLLPSTDLDDHAQKKLKKIGRDCATKPFTNLLMPPSGASHTDKEKDMPSKNFACQSSCSIM